VLSSILTVSDVLLMHLTISLDNAKTVADSVGHHGSSKPDEGLSLTEVSDGTMKHA
jgi:hypothetical protein